MRLFTCGVYDSIQSCKLFTLYSIVPCLKYCSSMTFLDQSSSRSNPINILYCSLLWGRAGSVSFHYFTKHGIHESHNLLCVDSAFLKGKIRCQRLRWLMRLDISTLSLRWRISISHWQGMAVYSVPWSNSSLWYMFTLIPVSISLSLYIYIYTSLYIFRNLYLSSYVGV